MLVPEQWSEISKKGHFFSITFISPPTYEETVRMDTMQTTPLVTENVQFLTSRQGQVIQTV